MEKSSEGLSLSLLALSSSLSSVALSQKGAMAESFDGSMLSAQSLSAS